MNISIAEIFLLIWGCVMTGLWVSVRARYHHFGKTTAFIFAKLADKEATIRRTKEGAMEIKEVDNAKENSNGV